MLDDDAGGAVELVGETARAREVVQVVERERAAARDCWTPVREVDTGALLDVVGGALVRDSRRSRARAPGRERERDPLRERLAILQPAENRRVVGGGMREGGCREAAPRRVCKRATLAQLGEHAVVLRSARHDADACMVLGGRPDQRRAADVDIRSRCPAARRRDRGSRRRGRTARCRGSRGRSGVIPWSGRRGCHRGSSDEG